MQEKLKQLTLDNKAKLVIIVLAAGGIVPTNINWIMVATYSLFGWDFIR